MCYSHQELRGLVVADHFSLGGHYVEVLDVGLSLGLH